MIVSDVKNMCRRILADDSAQGLLEYALIIGLVAMVAIVALTFFGNKTNNKLNNDQYWVPG